MRLRRAVIEDMAAVAVLLRLTMKTSLPYLPDLHTPEDDLWFFSDVQFPKGEIWVAEADGVIIGFAARSPGWLDHLYVHPDHHGGGVGHALLEQARADVSGLQLWAFQRNSRARAFYEAHGFVLERLTDGSGNEEREPDALYVWTRPSITNG
jgi:putative acetyltransferase